MAVVPYNEMEAFRTNFVRTLLAKFFHRVIAPYPNLQLHHPLPTVSEIQVETDDEPMEIE